MALVLLALLAGAAAWGQVTARYNDIPATLELHFPPAAPTPIVTVVSRDAIFELPRTASLILGVNLLVGLVLHAWDRVAGYVLFLAATAVQAAFFAAIAIAIALA